MEQLTPAVQFPEVAGLERSADGSELIYGGSVAINRLLGYFRDAGLSGKGTPWSLYLINVFTLADNVYRAHKKASFSQQMEAFHHETDILCRYIEAYAAALPSLRRPPTIVFYVPSYDRIPDKLRRERAPDTEAVQVETFYNHLTPMFSPRPASLPDAQFSQRWVVPVGRMTFPHRDLVTWLQGMASKITYTYQRDPVALITHCPLDLHIHRILNHVVLLERFTGEIHPPSQFGLKLDKSGDVPFNTYTHRVLGDKLQLAPLAQRNVRKELLAAAKKNHWMHKSQNAILSDITKITEIPATELMRLKL